MIELQNKLRVVTDDDRKKLLTTSYSALDLFCNCRFRYNQQKNLKKYATSSTIALDLGNILHKGLELKGTYIMNEQPVDYENIKDTVINGCDEVSDKTREHLPGITEIEALYSKDWLESIETTDQLSYPQKIQLYLDKVLPTRMEEDEWQIEGTEVKFDYVYDDKIIITGFIDRIDSKIDENGEKQLRVVDYKSSKKIFDDSKIKTPLQMVVYDLACLQMYGILPIEHEYDFILLDKKQTSQNGVCSKGYLKRGLKKIDSILDKMAVAAEANEYPPSPTPLCYWCPFPSKLHTPNADATWAGTCPYYSLWKPDKKIFQVNQDYVPGEKLDEVRKLIF